MHYKNGREAKNGDKVVMLCDYGGAPVAGVLYDAQPGNDYCNGRIATTSTSDATANLKDCLHFDDVRAALAATPVPDTSRSAASEPSA